MKIKFLIIILLLFNNILCNVTEEKITNPIIAMGLSAVVPGAGQIYNGNWKKGLLFLGLEIISFNQMHKYNKSAESYVRDYEDYADEYWHIEKWLQDFYLFVDWIPEGYDSISENVFYDSNVNYIDIGIGGNGSYSHGPDFIYNNNSYSHRDIYGDYESVCGSETSTNIMENGGSCDLWEFSNEGFGYVLNNDPNVPCDPNNPSTEPNCNLHYIMPWGTLEFDNNQDTNPTPNYSSIVLIRDHHLYEGIGKYNEFFAGWDDATLEEARQVYKNGTDVATSDKKDYYQNMRNKSNSEFDKEELFLSLIFVNHAVSMFVAFLTSVNRTKKVKIESNMKYGYNNGIEINLKW